MSGWNFEGFALRFLFSALQFPFCSPVSIYLDGILKDFSFLGGISKSRTPKCRALIWPNLQEIGSELANSIGNQL
ncbi:uncharacterized protein OCT59_015387 [Rhizophagus irregularis]|uniref:uncharacterized protein n=1 Tax=Rhizophagus irregularis TaxID=588596 RepID=UPI0033224D35|nr:hypothetical protein OCT59_015387 [Rhizophagus irregularis]